MGAVVLHLPSCWHLACQLPFAIGISGTVFFLVTPDIPMSIVVQKVVSSSQSFTLLAIPLFIFAGNLMNNTVHLPSHLSCSNVLTGHMYGKPGTDFLRSLHFDGRRIRLCKRGRCHAEAVFWGPDMTKRGYAKGYSAAVNGVTSLINRNYSTQHGADYLWFCRRSVHRAAVLPPGLFPDFNDDRFDDHHPHHIQKTGVYARTG